MTKRANRHLTLKEHFLKTAESFISRYEAHQEILKKYQYDPEIIKVMRNSGNRNVRVFTLHLSELPMLNALGRLSQSPLDLRWANLSRNDLSEVCLFGADLRYAEMIDTPLDRTDLREADLRGVIGLTEDNLCVAIIDENTKLDPRFDDMKRNMLATYRPPLTSGIQTPAR